MIACVTRRKTATGCASVWRLEKPRAKSLRPGVLTGRQELAVSSFSIA
jgi:hypothetical protein